MKALRLLRCALSSLRSACLPILPPLMQSHTRHCLCGLRITSLPRLKPSLLLKGRAVKVKKGGHPFPSMRRGMSRGLPRSMKMAGKSRSASARAGLCSSSGFLLVEGMLVVVITILLVSAVSDAMTVFYQSDEHIEEAADLYDEQYRLALERGNGCDINCRVTPEPTEDPL